MPVISYDSAVAKHLHPGEQLRWVGRPVQGSKFSWRNRSGIVVVALGFFLIWWAGPWSYRALESLSQHQPVMRLPMRFYGWVVVFAGVLFWHLTAERRRRAGTWYAVTDQRVIFILTTESPESVVALAYNEVTGFFLRPTVFGPPSVVVQLKEIDPYMALSSVLGYQQSGNAVEIDDMENPRAFFKQASAAKRVQDNPTSRD